MLSFKVTTVYQANLEVLIKMTVDNRCDQEYEYQTLQLNKIPLDPAVLQSRLRVYSAVFIDLSIHAVSVYKKR